MHADEGPSWRLNSHLYRAASVSVVRYIFPPAPNLLVSAACPCWKRYNLTIKKKKVINLAVAVKVQIYTVQSFSIKNKSRLASRKPGSKSFCPSVFEGNYQVEALSDGLPLETPSLTTSIKPEGSSYCKYHNKANPVKTDSGQTYVLSSER